MRLHESDVITNYKFGLKHEMYSKEQIRTLLVGEPFKMLPMAPYRFILEKPIDRNQRLLRVHIKKGELVFALQWPYDVSEKYLDYLVQASIMIGRITSAMEVMLESSQDWRFEVEDDEQGADAYMSRPEPDQDLLDLDAEEDADEDS
jgi:hypothetical protein